MEEEFPKRLFPAGAEPKVDHINNSCKMSLMKKIKEALPKEYVVVLKDPAFSNILAIYENDLKFSARLVHSMMCRQLYTLKKHELWCLFGGRPIINVTLYDDTYAAVKPGLNKSNCDCGAYAIKYIECHLRGFDHNLMDDENIRKARHKIVLDLWLAASDPVLIERMSKYEPTKFDTTVQVID